MLAALAALLRPFPNVYAINIYIYIYIYIYIWVAVSKGYCFVIVDVCYVYMSMVEYLKAICSGWCMLFIYGSRTVFKGYLLLLI